jgi:hypothetical protein
MMGVTALICLILVGTVFCPVATGRAEPAAPEKKVHQRTGQVRVVDHALVDDGGPFLGLGVSYFTALWRCRHNRQRLESDLQFLSEQGFDYYRMLSMVGWHQAWDGLEVAPVAFTNRAGKRVDAWPDYWRQLTDLIRRLKEILPGDLPNWQRNDGRQNEAPFTVFADGQPNRYWQEALASRDGCLRNIGSRKGDGFVCVPIGIREGGLQLQAREDLQIEAFDPLTGKIIKSARMKSGEGIALPASGGGLILKGRVFSQPTQ